MNIEKALSFVKDDPRRNEKLAVGTGVLLASFVLTSILIGYVGFFVVLGYGIRLTQNVRDGHDYPLPEWDQWGDDLIRGFKLTVVNILWSLPFILFVVPVALGGILADSGGGGEAIGILFFSSGLCLLFLYGIFFTLAIPAIIISFAKDEQIGSGIKLNDIWQWTRKNIAESILMTIVIIAASFVIIMLALIVGFILCGVGLVVTLPLGTLAVYLFQYHLIGQLAHKYPMGDLPKRKYTDDADADYTNDLEMDNFGIDGSDGNNPRTKDGIDWYRDDPFLNTAEILDAVATRQPSEGTQTVNTPETQKLNMEGPETEDSSAAKTVNLGSRMPGNTNLENIVQESSASIQPIVEDVAQPASRFTEVSKRTSHETEILEPSTQYEPEQYKPEGLEPAGAQPRTAVTPEAPSTSTPKSDSVSTAGRNTPSVNINVQDDVNTPTSSSIISSSVGSNDSTASSHDSGSSNSGSSGGSSGGSDSGSSGGSSSGSDGGGSGGDSGGE